MSHYIHHVPGRLRVKTTALKRNERRAATLSALLQAMDGVLNTEINTITGSVIVKYDVRRIGSEAILMLFRERGYLASKAQVALTQSLAIPKKTSRVGKKVGAKVLDMLVEKAVERSIIALIGAIF